MRPVGRLGKHGQIAQEGATKGHGMGFHFDLQATDGRARKAATMAIHHRMDLKLPEPIRQFFYLPFMHGETTFDQDRCICLMIARLPETGADNLRHARAHRDIIRRFGRFPYRNAALGRQNTPAEEAFFAAGGYMSVVNELA